MERENYPIPPNERIAAPVERNNSLTWLAGLVMIVLGVLFLVGQTLYSGDLFASILLMGFGATFFAVYLTNRKHWWALIPTYILMVTGTFIAIEPMLWGEGDAIYWLVAVGLPFLYLFVTDPSKRWWALIPTYIMASTAVYLLIAGILPGGNWDGVYWLSTVGVPFLVLFATDPAKRWWALIPAYVFASTGTFLIVEPVLWGDLDGAYWLFAIALPFFVVYATGPRDRWWALIPGGILASIGVGLFLSSIALVLPVLFIVAGIVLLTRQAKQRRAKAAPSMEPSVPQYGPEADRPLPEFEPLGTREPEMVVQTRYDR